MYNQQLFKLHISLQNWYSCLVQRLKACVASASAWWQVFDDKHNAQEALEECKATDHSRLAPDAPGPGGPGACQKCMRMSTSHICFDICAITEKKRERESDTQNTCFSSMWLCPKMRYTPSLWRFERKQTW